jgi:GGDEF domain-containing protein
MEIFDKVEPKTLDRRHWQLSMLSLGMIIVLGGGVALLMYPAVFGGNAAPTGHTTRTLFFGFCALCVLVVAYLLNRQYVVHQLRKNLVEQKTEMAHLRQEASADLLGTVPGFNHFQDRLTMGFRRAAQTGEPLSLVLVRLKPSHMFDSPQEVSVALGDAARVLLRKLRTDDSLYHLSSGVFAMVLPNTCGAGMNGVESRVTEGLADASGASNRFTFDMQAINYPEQVSSAYEMEHMADAFSFHKGSAAVKVEAAEAQIPEMNSSQ